jgi:hypothetical protein
MKNRNKKEETMKKNFQRLALAGLFALSVGAAGATFTALAFAPPAYAFAKCPTCDGSNGCVGSTCDCIFLGGHSFSCAPAAPNQP